MRADMFPFILFIVVLQLGQSIVHGQACTSGKKLIMEIGISKGDIPVIIEMHNKYRQMIANGQVFGQPLGVNLNQMKYDERLARKARTVAITCKKERVHIFDPRWQQVGQNLHIEYRNETEYTPNWRAAVKSWYDKHQNYIYGKDITSENEDYTQLVWAQSYAVGCDFVMFHDVTKSDLQFGYLYICNYGPGGNIKNQVPYEALGGSTNNTRT